VALGLLYQFTHYAVRHNVHAVLRGGFGHTLENGLLCLSTHDAVCRAARARAVHCVRCWCWCLDVTMGQRCRVLRSSA
jgi:hypothetical protein